MESKTGLKRSFFEGVSADIVEGLAAVHWGAGFENCFGLVHVEFGGLGNEFEVGAANSGTGKVRNKVWGSWGTRN